MFSDDLVLLQYSRKLDVALAQHALFYDFQVFSNRPVLEHSLQLAVSRDKADPVPDCIPGGPDQKLLSFESVFLMSIQSKYRSHDFALPLALQPGNSNELPSSHLQCERLRI